MDCIPFFHVKSNTLFVFSISLHSQNQNIHKNKYQDMLTIKQITENTDAVLRGLEKKHFKNAKETIAPSDWTLMTKDEAQSNHLR